jgi:hypothetical protein
LPLLHKVWISQTPTRDPKTTDGQRAPARYGTRGRGAALSRHRQGYLDLPRLAGRVLGSRYWRNRRPPTWSAASPAAASRTAGSAPPDRRPSGPFRGSTIFSASPSGPGRCGRCRAAMSRRDRRTWPRRRRSTRAICPTRPTGARSSVGSASFAGSSLHRRSPVIAEPRACRVRQLPRRRTARLCATEGLDGLSRDPHLQDGRRPDGGGRRPAARQPAR